MAATQEPGPRLVSHPPAADRLDSWKEIAAYLGRSDRTVRRWEQSLSLPVHRLSEQKRATVFALKSELDAWWRHSGEAAAAAAARPRPTGRNRLWAAAAVALVALLATVGFLATRPSGPAALPSRQLTFDTGSTSYPAISPDGKLVAYASDRSGRGDYDIYVQPVAGGHATRLTDHPARDYAPDISPDGSRVVFHSYRDGSGVYVVPVAGGPETRLADRGDNPRFSPDGALVAFDLDLPDETYSIWVVPASGGPARRITTPEFRYARGPLWTPDGRYVLFLGATRSEPEAYDLWAAPLDGGPQVRTGVSEALTRQGLAALRFFHWPRDWIGHDVVFVHGPHQWRMPLSPGTLRPAGPARPLTSGFGRERYVRFAGRAGVVAAVNVQTHLWEFEFDPDRAVMAEQGRQLTRDVSLVPSLFATRPSVSADGRLLVYASSRAGNYDVWLQDLSAGTEKLVAGGPLEEIDPVVAPDGSAVAFARREDGRVPILIARTGGETRPVCGDCGSPDSWSADGRFMLFTTPAGRLEALDLHTGARSRLPASVPVITGSFSPDGRTVAIGVRLGQKERVFLVPFDRGHWPPEREWVPLSDLQANAVAWAPGGGVAYFLSLEDNYRCLWARRIDPKTRRPAGSPFAVRHFHSVQAYPQMSRWVAVVRDRIFLRLTRENANLWSVELR